MSGFSKWDFSETVLKALAKEELTTPTDIQNAVISDILGGKDLLGIARTGTGKTLAFALPIIQNLISPKIKVRPARIRSLVLVPTRELAQQIEKSFKNIGKSCHLKIVSLYGGVGVNPQIHALAKGVDVLVATPGRFLDIHQQGHIFFDQLEVFVLDEADRMLDMGFHEEVQKIMDILPSERQCLMFSATLGTSIGLLAGKILRRPVVVNIAPEGSLALNVSHSLLPVEKVNKPQLLQALMKKKSFKKVLVFSRTKHGADRIVRHLRKIEVDAVAIHGNKSQGARDRAIKLFKRNKVQVLVATDIAARGIDMDKVTHVINYDLPGDGETYVHRIGRTARGERAGYALSFCDQTELKKLALIENFLREKITVDTAHPMYEVPARFENNT